eukprot:4350652-Prymnesium_polylepis.1
MPSRVDSLPRALAAALLARASAYVGARFGTCFARLCPGMTQRPEFRGRLLGPRDYFLPAPCGGFHGPAHATQGRLHVPRQVGIARHPSSHAGDAPLAVLNPGRDTGLWRGRAMRVMSGRWCLRGS